MIDLETAELSILGSVLLTNGRALEEIDFAPADYRHPSFEFIHRAMVNMKVAGEPIDQLTVMDRVMKSGEKIDPLILHKAADVTPSAANVGYYAGIVTDSATMRRLSAAATRVQDKGTNVGDAD